MKIQDFPKDNRPRERFLTHGEKALSNTEPMALILGTGNPKEGVVNMSNRLIKEYGLENLGKNQEF